MPSTAIRAFSWDEDSETLFVQFLSGDTYAYFDVPQAVHEDFRAASSKGRFFQAEVRDRYAYRRMPPGTLIPPRPPEPA